MPQSKPRSFLSVLFISEVTEDFQTYSVICCSLRRQLVKKQKKQNKCLRESSVRQPAGRRRDKGRRKKPSGSESHLQTGERSLSNTDQRADEKTRVWWSYSSATGAVSALHCVTPQKQMIYQWSRSAVAAVAMVTRQSF